MKPDLSCELLELLPPIYREIEDYQQICAAEKNQFERLADGVHRVQDNFFVQTMDEDSVSRWERVFHIRALPSTETMAFRRQRVLSRLRTRPPFTLGFLYQQLDELIGARRWDCEVDYPAYSLTIRADAEKEASRTELPHLVNQIKPAHIAFCLCLVYDPTTIPIYAASAPCSAVTTCTVRIPGVIGPKEVTGRAYAVSAASSTRVQATVALPGVIGPKAVSAPALAGSRLANTRETITIKIGGITI